VTGVEVASPSSPGTAAPGSTSAGAPASESVTDPAEAEPSGRDAWPWLLGGLLGVAALVVLLRAVRPR
jgi:hypothetical protein